MAQRASGQQTNPPSVVGTPLSAEHERTSRFQENHAKCTRDSDIAAKLEANCGFVEERVSADHGPTSRYGAAFDKIVAGAANQSLNEGAPVKKPLTTLQEVSMLAYYHGNVSDDTTKMLLLNKGEFLLRLDVEKKAILVSVMWGGKVLDMMLRAKSEAGASHPMYTLDSKMRCPTIGDLIRSHTEGVPVMRKKCEPVLLTRAISKPTRTSAVVSGGLAEILKEDGGAEKLRMESFGNHFTADSSFVCASNPELYMAATAHRPLSMAGGNVSNLAGWAHVTSRSLDLTPLKGVRIVLIVGTSILDQSSLEGVFKNRCDAVLDLQDFIGNKMDDGTVRGRQIKHVIATGEKLDEGTLIQLIMESLVEKAATGGSRLAIDCHSLLQPSFMAKWRASTAPIPSVLQLCAGAADGRANFAKVLSPWRFKQVDVRAHDALTLIGCFLDDTFKKPQAAPSLRSAQASRAAPTRITEESTGKEQFAGEEKKKSGKIVRPIKK